MNIMKSNINFQFIIIDGYIVGILYGGSFLTNKNNETNIHDLLDFKKRTIDNIDYWNPTPITNVPGADENTYGILEDYNGEIRLQLNTDTLESFMQSTYPSEDDFFASDVSNFQMPAGPAME